MFEIDPETKRYLYYGLMAMSVLFLVLVFGSRYLTRHHNHEEDDLDRDD